MAFGVVKWFKEASGFVVSDQGAKGLFLGQASIDGDGHLRRCPDCSVERQSSAATAATG